MSNLVGNPKDRFSHVAAHIVSCKKKVKSAIIHQYFEENDRSTKLFRANTVLAYGSNLFECLHILAADHSVVKA